MIIAKGQNLLPHQLPPLSLERDDARTLRKPIDLSKVDLLLLSNLVQRGESRRGEELDGFGFREGGFAAVGAHAGEELQWASASAREEERKGTYELALADLVVRVRGGAFETELTAFGAGRCR